MSELLIGCGKARAKVISQGSGWTNLVTLDHEPSHEPDVQHDLNVLPYPFEDESFTEVHAYDVLEHVGFQGDWRFFFAQWTEFHRILKPGGLFCGIVPLPDSPWAWGDPSHTRIIPIQQLYYLSQRFYDQVGKTAASDFRAVWKGNFDIIHKSAADGRQVFVLRKT